MVIVGKFPKYKFLFAAADFIIVFSSFILSAYLLRSIEADGISSFIELSFPLILYYIIPSAILLFVFQMNNLYRVNVIITRAAHLTEIIKSIYYGAVPVIIFSLVISSNIYTNSSLVFFAANLMIVVFSYIIRVEILRFIFLTLNSQFHKRIAIVGYSSTGKLLAAKLLFENPEGIQIAGFLSTGENTDKKLINGFKALGHIDDIKKIHATEKFDEVIIAIDDITYDRLLEILDICQTVKADVKLSSQLFSIVAQKISTEKYADISLLGITPRYNNSVTLFFKRLFDILLSFLMIVILSPLYLIISFLIKMTSKGPLIFKQERIGKDGKLFKMYKFRSMYTMEEEEDEERKKLMLEYMQNEESDTAGTKIINESRITWIGKFIRKTSLDEMPQLFNVLLGNMSLVGPRPCLPYEYENYDSWQRRRVKATPGCTGVWQVWGRSVVSFKDSIILDIYYLNNMSPWLDLQLLLKTIPVIIFGKGGK